MNASLPISLLTSHSQRECQYFSVLFRSEEELSSPSPRVSGLSTLKRRTLDLHGSDGIALPEERCRARNIGMVHFATFRALPIVR
jgi:hypothetical protein